MLLEVLKNNYRNTINIDQVKKKTNNIAVS